MLCRASDHPPALQPGPPKTHMNAQTTSNHLLIYAVHLTPSSPLPLPVPGPPAGPSARAAGAAGAPGFLGEPRDLCDVAINAAEAAQLPHDAAAAALAADARSVVVGFSDGCMLALSWGAKVRRRRAHRVHRGTARGQEAVDAARTSGWGSPRAAPRAAADASIAACFSSVAACAPPCTLQLKSELLDPLNDALAVREQQAQQGSGRAQPGPADGGGKLHPARAIVQLDFAPGSGHLLAVMADGAAALCRAAPESGLAPLDQLRFSHWLCGPAARATTGALAAPLGLAAIGCAGGEVLLVRLAPPPPAAAAASSVGTGEAGGEAASASGGSLHGANRLAGAASLGGAAPWPASSSGAGGAFASYGGAADDPSCLARCLHLRDWGHTPGQTGGVRALAWAPDCRALAVGYVRQGLSVWTPSGCRLMCTVRQPDAARTPRLGPAAANGGGSCGGTPTAAAGAGAVGSGGPLDGGVQALAWGVLGYSLFIATTACGTGEGRAGSSLAPDAALDVGGGGGGDSLVEVQFAKSLPNNHSVAQVAVAGGGGELHMLQVGRPPGCELLPTAHVWQLSACLAGVPISSRLATPLTGRKAPRTRREAASGLCRLPTADPHTGVRPAGVDLRAPARATCAGARRRIVRATRGARRRRWRQRQHGQRGRRRRRPMRDTRAAAGKLRGRQLAVGACGCQRLRRRHSGGRPARPGCLQPACAALAAVWRRVAGAAHALACGQDERLQCSPAFPDSPAATPAGRATRIPCKA